MSEFQYIVASNLQLSRRLTRREIEEFDYMNQLNQIEAQNFHTFFEIRNHPNYTNYERINGEDRLREDYYPRFSNWFYDEQNLTLDHFEDPDNFVITTLHYLVKNFFIPKNIDISGKVTCINRNVIQGYVYDIRNDNFTYNINESINLLEDLENVTDLQIQM